jgi:hypothetical protein
LPIGLSINPFTSTSAITLADGGTDFIASSNGPARTDDTGATRRIAVNRLVRVIIGAPSGGKT